MGDETLRPVLAGQKALVIGVANDDSIAYGCAKAFHATGADLAITWLNEKARPYVEPLARELGASITGAVDVAVPGQLEAMFDQIRTKWGRLDILVHSIAFAPKSDLQGGLLNCSAEGFAKAMDISCHSFIRMAKLAAPLMTEGGTMFAMSYYGANRVVANYNVMGPVKAALEAACRYLAYELGSQGIRVHANSHRRKFVTALGHRVPHQDVAIETVRLFMCLFLRFSDPVIVVGGSVLVRVAVF